jgi:hypothetical protein
MNRKRSSRIAIKESEQEEETRIANERAENSARLSRASRHKVIPANPVEEPGASGISIGATGETREERLRKREEEKFAKMAAIEEAAMKEAARMEREAAIEANGGIVPPGMETPAELAVMREQAERERKRQVKEAWKKKKEAEKKKAKQERAAAKKSEQAALLLLPLEVVDEDPWYLDCELCHQAGWNMVSLVVVLVVRALTGRF